MNRRPSLSELSQARPLRGKGAPKRCASHKSAILALLGERGSQGVFGSELYSRPYLYGRSPRNRISELRKDGHLIEGKPYGSSDWWYRLIRDNTGNAPSCDATQSTPESACMRRKCEERDRAMPLFARYER
jgi:hypothetical protein